MAEITVYQAASIITMCRSRPRATHVAVSDGRIVAVGSAEDMRHFPGAQLDDSLKDHVFLPGFVEGHSHCDVGAFEHMVPVGAYDRVTPDGKTWTGLADVASVQQRLIERVQSHNEAVVIGWAFDPFHVDRDLTRIDLDRVSSDRPVIVSHSSGGHVMYMNTCALEAAGLFPPPAPHDGINLAKDGLPTGRIAGTDLLVPAATKLGVIEYFMGASPALVRAFARTCVRAGVTTATELALILDDGRIKELADDLSTGLPIRLYAALYSESRDDVTRAQELKPLSNDFFRLGAIKLVVDGSIQGLTARVGWPGYHNGSPNGLWYIAPEQLEDVLATALREGVQAHVHTNGDEATALTLGCVERALRKSPSWNHRTILQHAQLMNAAQMRHAKDLGVGINLFANHLYYWGDVHREITVGPERAARMNACRTALDTGLNLAIHSDDPVTPIGPLTTAWCAVNRKTSSGKTLGPEECITVAEALHAITLGAAWTLGMDNEIGSIEAGKRADFAILGDDPLSVSPENLRDIPIWGTMLGGVLQPADRS